jgi:hypothetical protein
VDPAADGPPHNLASGDHTFGNAQDFRRIGQVAQQVSAIQDSDAPETLALLDGLGVTHVYIGARGGSLVPEMFVSSPHYRLLYSNGAAWVFAVLSDGAAGGSDYRRYGGGALNALKLSMKKSTGHGQLD